MHNQSVDIVINGGSTLGLLTALAILEHTALSVAVIEQNQITHETADPRYVALAQNSVRYLAELGIDPHLLGPGIEQIHVSDQGHIGQCRLTAKEVSVAELGVVVNLSALTQCITDKLYEKYVDSGRLLIYSGYVLQSVESIALAPLQLLVAPHTEAHIGPEVNPQATPFEDETPSVFTLSSELLFFADGERSPLKTELGFTKSIVDFGQYGVVANVAVDRVAYSRYHHPLTAFERFTKHGPLALLPIHTPAGQPAYQQWYSMVWCIAEDQKDGFAAIDLAALQEVFGDRAGRFCASTKPYVFPLKLTQHQGVVQRCICLGNAAQALHPIAGQGFNLGVRDIKDAVFILQSQIGAEQSVAHIAAQFSAQFTEYRRLDRAQTVTATSALVSIFSNDIPGVNTLRNFGLLTLHKYPFLKSLFTQQAMGEK
ncbi:FAD-dependent monooxygenase [Opacimonas viscosa]|nr:FAD-dependent monooxygenase [Opacimonas viscosa]